MRHREIRIRFVPKREMRYSDTLGDWLIDSDGVVCIIVSDEGTEEEQFLVALHELIEWKLCSMRGISQKAVDDFDLAYKGENEPGDEVLSPYRKEHRFSMLIEHLMAHEMGLVGYGTVE